MDFTSPPPLPPPAYKDCSNGLKVFGVFEVLFGIFCLLFIPLTVVGQLTADRSANPFGLAFALPSLLIFAVGGIGAVWLGVGSIQARRWARTLLLCVGGTGLVVGLAAIIPAALTLSGMDEMLRQQSAGKEIPSGLIMMVKVITGLVMLVMYVVIPGTLFVFYRRENVRLTCEARDPVVRWTDRCPPPVLSLCLMQGFTALTLGGMLPLFGSAFPLAGFIVTGWLAYLLWLGLIALSLWAAYGFYRLELRAWLIFSTVWLGCCLSSIATFARVGLLDFYRSLDFTPEQMNLLAKSPLMQGNAALWMTVGGTVLFCGYLFYVRRYFLPKTPQVAG